MIDLGAKGEAKKDTRPTFIYQIILVAVPGGEGGGRAITVPQRDYN